MDCGSEKMTYRYSLFIKGKRGVYVLETNDDIDVEDFVVEKEVVS